MKTHLLIFLLFSAAFASAVTTGQYEVRVYNGSGFDSTYLTLTDGQVIGKTGGVPAAITPFDGVFGSLTSKPTTLSGYGITDAQSLTGALALAGFGSITGTIPVANGGTGQTSLGSGVSSALGSAVDASGGLLTYGIIGTSGTKVPLLNTANTFGAAQTVPSLITSDGQITAPKAASSTTASLDFYAQTGAAGYPSNNDKWFTWSADINGTKVEVMKLYAKDATTWGLSGPFGIYPAAIGPNVTDGTTQFAYGTLRFVVATVLFSQFGTTLDISKDDASYPFVVNATNGAYHFGNTTSSQVLRVMGTFSSATNYEAGVIDLQTSDGRVRIGSAVGSGGGSARPVDLIYGDAVKVTLGANTTDHAQPLKLPSYTVSGLPSASTCGAGSMAIVTDSTSTTAYTTVSGGGGNKVLVVSDGTNWVIH